MTAIEKAFGKVKDIEEKAARGGVRAVGRGAVRFAGGVKYSIEYGRTGKAIVGGAHAVMRGAELSKGALKRLKDARADLRWKMRQAKQERLEHKISEAQYEQQIAELEDRLEELRLTTARAKIHAKSSKSTRKSLKNEKRKGRKNNPIREGLSWLDKVLPAKSRSRRRSRRSKLERM